jgi:hypothetical protein
LYARVSSQQQADAHTIASQVAALKARIRSDGFRLEEELCFLDEGYSGSTLFRPSLERLRDQAAACSFDRLYVHSPDRLARAYAYQVLLVEELQRHAIEILHPVLLSQTFLTQRHFWSPPWRAPPPGPTVECCWACAVSKRARRYAARTRSPVFHAAVP